MHQTKTTIDDSFIHSLNEVQKDHESGDFDAAERGYRELIDKQPAIWQLHFNLGMLLFDQHRFKEALTCYLDGLAVNNSSIDLFFNSGICCKQLGRYGEAIDLYRKALALDPDDLDCRYNLGGCYLADGQQREALSTYLEILESDPEHLSSLNNAAYLFHKHGDNEQARDHYRRILQIDPDHAAAGHMFAALSGAERGAVPQSYVRDVFDQFADHYDTSLTDNLDYRLPAQLFEFYRSIGGKQSIDHLLDLGCGTGLLGAQFHSLCGSMTGIDLSANMIDAARAKLIYTALYVSEIVSYLESDQLPAHDLIISADVFPYIGDLAAVLRAALGCILPGSYYLFSVEHDESNGDRPQLQKSGRFCHSRSYIESVTKSTGWKITDGRIVNLRKERNVWITGCLYALVGN